MKTEREIAEEIFQLFRDRKCRKDQGFEESEITKSILPKLNPKEQDLLDVVFVGLQALGYIYVRKNNKFVCLAKNGLDYIYDDDAINDRLKKPWIIPEYRNTNWDKAFVNLWKIIGPQWTAEYYIGGPQFLNLIVGLSKDINTSYYEYIEERRNKNLIGGRNVYYKELIDLLSEKNRYWFYVRIQNFIDTNSVILIEPNDDIQDFIPIETSDTNSFQRHDENTQKDDRTTNATVRTDRKQSVFISYSWDNESHKNWVKKFADDLMSSGIEVIFDQYQPPGTPLTPFMMDGLQKADKVLIIGTPNYKSKAEKHQGGTNIEDQIINISISKDFLSTKYIPILRTGSFDKSFTTFVSDRKGFDFTDDTQYTTRLNELINELGGCYNSTFNAVVSQNTASNTKSTLSKEENDERTIRKMMHYMNVYEIENYFKRGPQRISDNTILISDYWSNIVNSPAFIIYDTELKNVIMDFFIPWNNVITEGEKYYFPSQTPGDYVFGNGKAEFDMFNTPDEELFFENMVCNWNDLYNKFHKMCEVIKNKYVIDFNDIDDSLKQ